MRIVNYALDPPFERSACVYAYYASTSHFNVYIYLHGAIGTAVHFRDSRPCNAQDLSALW